MKVWLNNLKEGDIFYHILLDNVYQCEHLGDAHNMNFRMPRIKYEIIEGDYNKLLFDIFGDNHEVFVNQYVYDDYESAEEACIDDLKKELKSIKESIVNHKAAIVNLETREQTLKERISNYERTNN